MKKNMDKNKLQIKWADAAVIMLCLLAAFILSVSLIGSRESGKTLRISHDGKTIMTVALQDNMLNSRKGSAVSEKGMYYLVTYEEDRAVTIPYEERPDIPSGINYNLLYISTNEVQMEAADCRDQICVHHRPITRGGESIICLPHRLVAEMIDKEQDGITDGMVK